MTERTVAVRLKAHVDGYIASFRAAGRATADFSKQSVEHAGKHKQAWDQVGKGMLVAGGLIGAGVALSVKSMMDFDKAMSGVKAVSSATGTEMDRLRKAALKAGADTAFSATDAAKAEAELAKVGISTADILGGALRGSLDLAAAGQLDLGEAATIAGQAMKIFGLQGKDVGHVADLLAAGANKSAADVHQLGEAMRAGGLVASQMGLHVEDTIGALSAFADNALIGSDAGTSLKTMLTALAAPSSSAADTMKQLGIDAFDAKGNFVGLAGLAEILQAKLGGLTQKQRENALATIFGTDAIRSANLLYKLGANGVHLYTMAVNDQGAAARMAGAQLDNLAGDVETLRGSLETAFIESGSAGNSTLRGLTQGANSLVNAYNKAPGPVKETAFAIGAVGSAALLTGGSLMVLLPRVAATKAAMAELGVSANLSASGLAKAGGSATLVGIALIGADYASKGFRKTIGDVPKDGDRAAATLERIAASGKVSGDQMGALGAKATSLHDALHHTFDRSAMENALAGLNQISSLGGIMPWGDDEVDAARRFFKSVDAGLTELVSSGKFEQADEAFKSVAAEATRMGIPVQNLTDELPSYTAALDTAKKQLAGSTDSTVALTGADKGLTAAQLDAASAAEQHGNDLKKLKNAIDEAAGGALGLRAASRGYEQALDEATKAAKDNGKTLDVHKAKGRANQAALDGIADSANDVTKQLIDNDASYRTVSTRAGHAREKFVEVAVSMGMSRDRAKELAAKLIAIPDRNVYVNVHTKGADSALAKLRQIQSLTNAIAGTPLPGSYGAGLGVLLPKYQHPGAGKGKGKGKGKAGRAGGGPIHGPGTSTSDDVEILASDGEFMQPTASVDYYGDAFMEDVRTRRFPKPAGYRDGGRVGYKRGGRVTDPVAPLAGSSALIGLLHIPQADDVNRAWDDQRAAAKRYRDQLGDVHRAERDLHKVERDRHATHAERKRAERELADTRRDLVKVTKDLDRATTAATKTERAFRSGISLRGYGGKLGAGIKASAGFQGNLEHLASRGFGDLAQEIAAVGGAEGADLARKASHASSGQLRKLTSQVKAQNRQKLLGEHTDTALALISTLAHAKHPMTLGELVDVLHTDAQTLVLLADLVGPTLRKMPSARAYLREARAGLAPGFRHGGQVGGAAGADANLIRATRDEFVFSPEATRAIGPDRLAAMNNLRFVPGAAGSYPYRGGGGAAGGGRHVQILPGARIELREAVDVDLLAARLDFHDRSAAFAAGGDR